MNSPPPPPVSGSSYCGNCGANVAPNAVACLGCGFRPNSERKFCRSCGAGAQLGQEICLRCGVALRRSNSSGDEKSKLAAGLLAIFLGGLGIHKFYLGYSTPGVILLAVTVGGFCLSFVLIGLLFFWVPGVIGLIEGIIYLTKSDDDFRESYVVNKREWF